MESEKVKEIKKAIEYNSVSEFMSRLPYTDEFNKLKMVSFYDILTLINELESENESQKKDISDYLGVIESRIVQEKEYKEKNHDLHIENVALKDRIAELEKEKTCVWEEWTDGDHSIWCCSNCKEDFCFMEGDVYENNYGYCPHCGAKITALKELKEDDIDETLKEIINE